MDASRRTVESEKRAARRARAKLIAAGACPPPTPKPDPTAKSLRQRARRQEIVAAKRQLQPTVEAQEQADKEAKIEEIFNELKVSACSTTYHLVIGYDQDDDIVKQDEVLKSHCDYIGLSCRCKAGSSTHRHVLVRVNKQNLNKLKGRTKVVNGYEKAWDGSVAKNDKRFVKIHCERHLASAMHYLTCKNSQNAQNGCGHNHHTFVDRPQLLEHEPSKINCQKATRLITKICKPTHDYTKCKCRIGLLAQSAIAFKHLIGNDKDAKHTGWLMDDFKKEMGMAINFGACLGIQDRHGLLHKRIKQYVNEYLFNVSQSTSKPLKTTTVADIVARAGVRARRHGTSAATGSSLPKGTIIVDLGKGEVSRVGDSTRGLLNPPKTVRWSADLNTLSSKIAYLQQQRRGLTPRPVNSTTVAAADAPTDLPATETTRTEAQAPDGIEHVQTGQSSRG
jgi:hypothetical protein